MSYLGRGFLRLFAAAFAGSYFTAPQAAVVVAPTPSFQAVGAKAEGTGDVTVNWPTHVANDVALLFVETNGNEPVTLGTPAGFTAVDGSPQLDDQGGNQTRLSVFWCRASGNAMASPVITDPGNHVEAVIVTYRGCRTFDVPYSATAGGSTEGTPGTAITVPGGITEAPNCRVVIAIANGGGWDASGYTNASLTGITERFDDYTGLGSSGGLSIADGSFAGPGDWGDTDATMGASQTCAFMTIALTGSSGSGSTAAEGALLPLGAPISASRIWTTGLSVEGADRYFIMQAYNYGSGEQPEWFVVDLDAGTYEMFLGPADIFANSNFQCGEGTASTATGGNQVRASNGRIFFPLRGLNIAYYDPTDHEIHHLPTISDPGHTHAAIFRLEFGNDGMIYGTTQADSGTGSQPVVFSLDPDTLDTAVLGHVGTLPNDLLYGYYLAVEDGASHAYVAVGQNPWELWSLELATGVATKLTPVGISGPFTIIEFNRRTEGWSVRFGNGTTTADYWIADGVLYAGAPVHNPADFAARDVTPDGPVLLSGAPEVEYLAAGTGLIEWRERGSGDPYTEINVTVTEGPIPLQAVAELADGDVLTVGEQYSGFARYDGMTNTHLLAHIISQPIFDGQYFAGYPNGTLYQYNPAAAWDPETNPVLLGDFGGNGLLSNMKYAYFLKRHSTNDRLYCAGRLERSGEGSGIGYYDIVGDSFDGHHDAPLDEYSPRGMAILETPGWLVFSGEKFDSSDAELIVYDLDLVELERLPVQTGMSDTGLLFLSPTEPNVVVGMTEADVYRFNVNTGALLTIQSLGGTRGATAQHSDGRILAVIDNDLVQIDPVTLAQTEVIGGMSVIPTAIVWGTKAYLVADTTLYEVEFP